MKTYSFTTKRDVVAFVLDCVQEYYLDYDIEAIANDVTDFNTNTQKFEMTIDHDTFWNIVEKHQV